MSENTVVAIVGYGPVGGAVANLLAHQGVEVVVVEPYAAVYPTPRAGALVPESMRFLQVAGLAEELVADMNVWNFWYDIFDKDWNLLVSRNPDMGPERQGWPHWHTFLQPELEKTLRAENERLGVRSLMGWRVAQIDSDADGATLQLARVDGSEEPRTLRADWVVGCDGFNSTVRAAMGATQEDLGGDDSWLVVHLQTPPEVELPPKLFEWCNPERAVTFVPGLPNNISAFEFRVLPGEVHADLEAEERVWEFLSPWLRPDQATILRKTVYTFRSRVCDTWRSGRLLLAGDSAHVMPPELGEGLNSGIRDAMNLGWKLGGVVNGVLQEDVLDTYQQERRPHVHAMVTLSHALATTISRIADDPDVERTELALGSVFTHPVPRMNPGLHGDAPEPAGLAADQPRLRSGELLDDVVGYRTAVIGHQDLLDAAGVDTDPVWQALGAVTVPADDPAVAAWLDRLGVRAVVVRPDRFVLGVATTAEELAALSGALGRYVRVRPAALLQA